MDNASNCDGLAKHLARLQPSFHGMASHEQCFAHIINLIVKVQTLLFTYITDQLMWYYNCRYSFPFFQTPQEGKGCQGCSRCSTSICSGSWYSFGCGPFWGQIYIHKYPILLAALLFGFPHNDNLWLYVLHLFFLIVYLYHLYFK